MASITGDMDGSLTIKTANNEYRCAISVNNVSSFHLDEVNSSIQMRNEHSGWMILLLSRKNNYFQSRTKNYIREKAHL